MDYFDTSNYSIGIGLVVFIMTFVVARYFLNDKYIKEGQTEDNNKTIVYSILSAILSTVIVLIAIKKILVYRGCTTMLSEKFDDV